jgi:hypothetical protein
VRGTYLLLVSILLLSRTRLTASTLHRSRSLSQERPNKRNKVFTVVPIFTEFTWLGGMAAFFTTASIARSTPCCMSGVVAVLCQASTLSFCKITLRDVSARQGASGKRFLTCLYWCLRRQFLSHTKLAWKASRFALRVENQSI